MSTLNKTNPKKWAERRIPCFAGTGDHTPQQNYYVGKPSFVGKGLDPFRKIQRAEFQKTVRYDNRPPHRNGMALDRSLQRSSNISKRNCAYPALQAQATVPYVIIRHK